MRIRGTKNPKKEEMQMIGFCRKCSKSFETTTEEACSPNCLCASCWHAERLMCPQCLRQDEYCPLCHGAGHVSRSQDSEWRAQNS